MRSRRDCFSFCIQAQARRLRSPDQFTWLIQGITQLTQFVTRLWVWLAWLTQGDTLKVPALGEPRRSPEGKSHGILVPFSIPTNLLSGTLPVLR